LPRLGRLLAGAAALAAFGVMGALACAAWSRAHATAHAAQAQPGEELYALNLVDGDGRMQPLSQWRGKTLVVNFWATWCAPCVAEMPALEKLQREFAGRNVAIVAIGTEDLEHVRQFRDRLGLHMMLLAGGYDAIALARSLGDEQGVLPYTAQFSASGKLVHTHAGALKPGQVEQWLGSAD